MGSENDPGNLVEAAGGKGPGLPGKETLHPDRRRRQAVKGSVPHGRCEETPAGIRGFFKAKFHLRAHVRRGRDPHREQRREVLCPIADEHPGRPAGCIILEWQRDLSGQPRCADGPERMCRVEGAGDSIPAAGQVLSFRAGITGIENAQCFLCSPRGYHNQGKKQLQGIQEAPQKPRPEARPSKDQGGIRTGRFAL